MATFRDATVDGLSKLIVLWNHGDAFRKPKEKDKPGQPCDGGCFWMAGNLFHTVVEGMVKVGLQHDTYNIGKEALEYFDECIPKTAKPREWRDKCGFWVDDYGWWGIAFMQAYSASDTLNYDPSMKQKFALYAQDCWEALNACWNTTPISWKKNGTQYTITGGIPNTSNGSPMLAGRNCVTNECYWRLSSILGQTFGDDYLDSKANANDFFLQAKAQSILFDPSLLVYERFFGLPKTEHADWTWLGDQGLFAICCYFNKQGTPGVFDQAQAINIIDHVQTNKKKKTASGVLHEELAPYSQYQLDYGCGKGTFMRNLAIINDARHRGSPSEAPYDSYIKLNAMAVWKNRQPDGIFPYYWDAESPEPDPTSWEYRQDTANAVLHAAGLSALNASLPWLEDQPIDKVGGG